MKDSPDLDVRRLVAHLPNGFTKGTKCKECGHLFAYDVRKEKTCPRCHIEDKNFIPWPKRKKVAEHVPSETDA